MANLFLHVWAISWKKLQRVSSTTLRGTRVQVLDVGDLLQRIGSTTLCGTCVQVLDVGDLLQLVCYYLSVFWFVCRRLLKVMWFRGKAKICPCVTALTCSFNLWRAVECSRVALSSVCVCVCACVRAHARVKFLSPCFN